MTTTAQPVTRVSVGIDPRGPQVTAAITTSCCSSRCCCPIHGPACYRRPGGALRHRRVRRVQRTPHAWLFRTLVRPRLSAPDELEDPAPPRFAQAVGLAFTLLALLGFAAGVTLLGPVAIGLALVAALLNAVFRFCLGCELYLMVKRFGS